MPEKEGRDPGPDPDELDDDQLEGAAGGLGLIQSILSNATGSTSTTDGSTDSSLEKSSKEEEEKLSKDSDSKLSK